MNKHKTEIEKLTDHIYRQSNYSWKSSKSFSKIGKIIIVDDDDSIFSVEIKQVYKSKIPKKGTKFCDHCENKLSLVPEDRHVEDNFVFCNQCIKCKDRTWVGYCYTCEFRGC